MLRIALLDHAYWVIGCMIGACIGEFFRFDMTGIDFSATAFFLVVVVNQLNQHRSKLPFVLAVLLQFRKKNMYLSINAGTACYMLLIRL